MEFLFTTRGLSERLFRTTISPGNLREGKEFETALYSVCMDTHTG